MLIRAVNAQHLLQNLHMGKIPAVNDIDFPGHAPVFNGDYHQLAGLRLEARQKLDAIRPGNLGQAARISGVSPADVAALMIALERQNRPGETP